MTACASISACVVNRPRRRSIRSASTPAKLLKSRMPTFAQNATTPSSQADPVNR